MKHRVVIEPLGEVIEVSEGQTILETALRAGIYLPHGCTHGVCSACKVEVLEGIVDFGDASEFALLDCERDEGKCLACCARPLTDLVIEADIELDPDARRYPVQDYEAVVTSVRDISPKIKSIFLALGGQGMRFQAGQYINLHLPGLDSARAFSVASPPSSPNIIELNVAFVQGGEGTGYLHSDLQVGDTVSFSGPYGRFYLRTSRPEPIIFLAGGSGLSGVKSMVMELVEKNDRRPITLIFGARNQDGVYYRELFEQYAQEHDNFRFILALDSGAAGLPGDVKSGRIHEVAKAHFGGKFEGYNVYVCGPPQMVDACITTLIQGRCFERHLFVENFYNQSSRTSGLKKLVFSGV